MGSWIEVGVRSGIEPLVDDPSVGRGVYQGLTRRRRLRSVNVARDARPINAGRGTDRHWFSMYFFTFSRLAPPALARNMPLL